MLDILTLQLHRIVSKMYLLLVPGRVLNQISHGANPFGSGRDAFDRFSSSNNREQIWEEARPILGKVIVLMSVELDVPFFDGSQRSYMAFVWANFLMYMRRIGRDVFQPLLSVSGNGHAHEALLHALAPCQSVILCSDDDLSVTECESLEHNGHSRQSAKRFRSAIVLNKAYQYYCQISETLARSQYHQMLHFSSSREFKTFSSTHEIHVWWLDSSATAVVNCV